jgi:hypothetical protein
MINDREDQAKFGNWDHGMVLDTRASLLQKAKYGNSSEIVVVFDDWEALAGKSFDSVSGQSVPNNNPNQYHNTIRWAANHPWIRISNLRDLLALALADPAPFVIDHGSRDDLPILTYEWLAHAAEDSYHNWYYDEDGGQPGNEQSFYDLVPVITGAQGDYHARGATPAQDGPPLPSGMPHGDLNTPGTLMYEAWQALQAAPESRLQSLGIASLLTMIYETGWHEEDMVDYQNPDCYGPWTSPDLSWDGVNTWALQLQNHVRQAGLYAAAAHWVAEVRGGARGDTVETLASDLDFDGEDEYVLENDRIYAVFEKYGGRCVLACAYDPSRDDGEVVVGAPFTNPSAPGEEEHAGPDANRCSAFKDMNGGGYADAIYAASAVASGWRFESPDGKIVKILTAAPGSYELLADYHQALGSPLYVRLGLSPNPLDLAFHGQDHLSQDLDLVNGRYWLQNSAGGGALVDLGGASFNPTPADAGWNRRNLGLTAEVELSGGAAVAFGLTLVPGETPITAVPAAPAPIALVVRGPWPSPSTGRARLSFALPERGPVRLRVVDLSGRLVASHDLGPRGPGPVEVEITPRGAGGGRLAPGLYLVRIDAGSRHATRRWVVLR